MPVKSPDQLTARVDRLVDALIAEYHQGGEDVPGLLVGMSGGLDSTVLLHLLWSACARTGKGDINAIHVNHGVDENSDAWAQFCRRTCDQLGIPLVISRHQLGDLTSNREAQYRKVRYRVFSEHLSDNGVLFTAHHQEDQAETVLLNLFRGAGLRGLRAMKQRLPFGTGLHIRPLLSVPRDILRRYALKHDLHWIDDPSNENTAYDRNYIRHRLMPSISRRWPAAAASISRTADNLAQSEQVIEEIGLEDMKHCTAVDYYGVINEAYAGVLDLNRLRRLSRARRLNALRRWIMVHSALNPGHDQLQQVSRDLCDGARSGLFELNGYQIRVYKNCLYLMQRMARAQRVVEAPQRKDGDYVFKSLSLRVRLSTTESRAGGSIHHPELRFAGRCGGETIRFRGLTRRLKTIYQHNSVPTWERDVIPLIYENDRLVAVPGIVLADNCPLLQASVSKYSG